VRWVTNESKFYSGLDHSRSGEEAASPIVRSEPSRQKGRQEVDNRGVRAADRWSAALSQWAIPERILSQAPESPWALPPWAFADAARLALKGSPTPTHLRTLEELPEGGALLDVGAGGGAASLPLSGRAALIVAVDQSKAMLAEMMRLTEGRTLVIPVEGTWPDVAELVDPADVVTCANVAYNIAALPEFVVALTAKARRRVVLELTASHPQAPLNWLWKHFWDLPRPQSPTADDAAMVVRETLGVDASVELWRGRDPLTRRVDPETVAWIRRRLCLSASCDEELARLLRSRPESGGAEMVTLWWPAAT
jgi:2-polyprenyl-3-methyl-5-hydroxy-6-metoxy-1,4-benzoquinol methylase